MRLPEASFVVLLEGVVRDTVAREGVAGDEDRLDSDDVEGVGDCEVVLGEVVVLEDELVAWVVPEFGGRVCLVESLLL